MGAGLILAAFTAVLILANLLIADSAYKFISAIFPKTRRIAVYIIPFLLSLLMVGFYVLSFRTANTETGYIKNILSFIANVWMGIFIYVFLLTALCRAVMLLCGLFKIIESGTLRKARIISGGITVVLICAVCIYGFANAATIKTKTYSIALSKPSLKSDITVALISDLHLGAINSENNLEKTVSAVNALSPDVVCIAGDIFNDEISSVKNPERVKELFKSICAKYGVFACLGNHDGGKTHNEMIKMIKDSGICLLNDEYEVADNRLIIAGRVDKSPIGGFSGEVRGTEERLLENADTSLPVIVMDHNPKNIGEYKKADLILCGHTHRGQIFPGSLITNSMYDCDYGYYRESENSPQVIVTSGCGYWGMPMRVGTDCEVVCIKLTGK